MEDSGSNTILILQKLPALGWSSPAAVIQLEQLLMSPFPLPCVPSHSSLGTSSWLGTCTVADGTAKFSFQPDQLPGGVCNRTRQTLESAHEKWEAPLVPAAEALVTPKPQWKANCLAQGSCKPLPAEGSTSSHPQQWMSPAPLTSSHRQDLSPSWGAAPQAEPAQGWEQQPQEALGGEAKENHQNTTQEELQL